MFFAMGARPAIRADAFFALRDVLIFGKLIVGVLRSGQMSLAARAGPTGTIFFSTPRGERATAHAQCCSLETTHCIGVG